MKIFRKILLALFGGFLACAIAFLGYYLIATKGVRLDENKLLLPDTQILIYDNADQKIPSSLSFSRRNVVAIDSLPKHLPAAFVCTEDKRFYRHGGFDFIGVARATVQNLKSRRFSQGASTISQQLIKNTHLTLDKTVSRKLKEWKLTRQLERKYSKAEILETYLNTIYFGHSCYGVADAAEFYFGKQAAELNAAESALLAGLVKAPNHYSPFKNAEKALSRRNTVLKLMLEQNALTKNAYETALNAPLPTANAKTNTRSYAHFAIEEMDQILENLGGTATGKIELFTYLQPRVQTLLQMQASAADCDKTYVVLDNETRGVAGYVSSISMAKRLPGSLIKPLLVYAPAFEEGISSPANHVLDERTDFGGYSPKNYGDEYFGYVSAREAIAKSLNVPAVKTLNALSLEKASAYAEKMELSVSQKDRTLALALGGMEHGYPFIKLVDGYTTFACDGKFAPSRFIREIKLNGNTVYRRECTERLAFSPETAYLITDTLKTAVKDGTAKRLRALPFPVAAKTGTVGIGSNNTDAYTVAYTTKHTVGVWVGNANNAPIQTTGGGLPCEVCRQILDGLYKEDYPEDFDRPTSVEKLSLDLYAYEREHRLLLADPTSPIRLQKTELFATRYAPKEISSRFSSPEIPVPKISYDGEKIRIFFETPPPDFYRYEIIKKANGKQTVAYEGNCIMEFVDRQLSPSTAYQYAVIPYYNHARGKPVSLPIVFTAAKNAPPIANTPWWEE